MDAFASFLHVPPSAKPPSSEDQETYEQELGFELKEIDNLMCAGRSKLNKVRSQIRELAEVAYDLDIVMSRSQSKLREIYQLRVAAGQGPRRSPRKHEYKTVVSMKELRRLPRHQ